MGNQMMCEEGGRKELYSTRQKNICVYSSGLPSLCL